MTVKKSDRTSKKRRYTTPGGHKRIEYHKRKQIKLSCSNCGKELLGIPTSMKKSKSERVPNRPYAGVYCSSCSRIVIKKNIHEKVKKMHEEVLKK